jgi:hypothetical protein
MKRNRRISALLREKKFFIQKIRKKGMSKGLSGSKTHAEAEFDVRRLDPYSAVL